MRGRTATYLETSAPPRRMELVGLFGRERELAVHDMATRMGRPATSIYHLLDGLLDAGIGREVGTRPKGKRFETLDAVTDDEAMIEAGLAARWTTRPTVVKPGEE